MSFNPLHDSIALKLDQIRDLIARAEMAARFGQHPQIAYPLQDAQKVLNELRKQVLT